MITETSPQATSGFERWAEDAAAALMRGTDEDVGNLLAELTSDHDMPGWPTPAARLGQLLIDGFHDSRSADSFRAHLNNILDSPNSRLAAHGLVDQFLGICASHLEPLEHARLLSGRACLRGHIAFQDDIGRESTFYTAALDDMGRALDLNSRFSAPASTSFRHCAWIFGSLLLEGDEFELAAEKFREALLGPVETASQGLYFSVATRVFRREMEGLRPAILFGLTDELSLAKALTPICRWMKKDDADAAGAVKLRDGSHYSREDFAAYWSASAIDRMALAALLSAAAPDPDERQQNEYEARWLLNNWDQRLRIFSPYASSERLQEALLGHISASAGARRDPIDPLDSEAVVEAQRLLNEGSVLDAEVRCRQALRESLRPLEAAALTASLSHAAGHGRSSLEAMDVLHLSLQTLTSAECNREVAAAMGVLERQAAYVSFNDFRMDDAREAARRALTKAERTGDALHIAQSLDLMCRIDRDRLGENCKPAYRSLLITLELMHGAKVITSAPNAFGKRTADTADADSDFFADAAYPFRIEAVTADVALLAGGPASGCDRRRIAETLAHHSHAGHKQGEIRKQLLQSIGPQLANALEALYPSMARRACFVVAKNCAPVAEEGDVEALLRQALQHLNYRAAHARTGVERARIRILRSQLLSSMVRIHDRLDPELLWSLHRSAKGFMEFATSPNAALEEADDEDIFDHREKANLELGEGEVLLDFAFSRDQGRVGDFSLSVWRSDGLARVLIGRLEDNHWAWLKRLPNTPGINRESINQLHRSATAVNADDRAKWTKAKADVLSGWSAVSETVLPSELHVLLKDCTRLYISPHGPLALLPLHMLLLDKVPIGLIMPCALWLDSSSPSPSKKQDAQAVANTALPQAAALRTILERGGTENQWMNSNNITPTDLLDRLSSSQHVFMFGHGLYRRAETDDARFCLTGGARLTVRHVLKSRASFSGTSVMLLACGSAATVSNDLGIQRSLAGALKRRGADAVLGCMSGQVNAELAGLFSSTYCENVLQSDDVHEAYFRALSTVCAGRDIPDQLALGAPFQMLAR